LALHKRKVLETARKHAQKGAKAKALKEYNKLLTADPRDAKLLLEVGDAYRRWGQADEAIAQYGKVAQQYRRDGFDARAVAVFKQILNLDPKLYAAYVSLSELYQRMGLDSEAIAALQTAADGYHQEGRRSEALDLLRQTAALDPTNTTSRLKVAELLRQEGMDSEALSEYQAVAEELENHQDREQVRVVLERILELKPDHIDALTSLVKNLLAAGEFDPAETFAIRALNVSAEPMQYQLLMDLYSQSGDETKLANATRGLAKLYRDRGDEEAARDLMQRLPAEEMDSRSRLAVDVSEVAEPDLADDELLDEEPFLTLDEEADSDASSADQEAALDGGELELGLEDEEPQTGAPVEPESLPEGDPDQLLAEANVYLRYGKRDQAIASLRGVIAQDPVHRAALEKLGEACAADGQSGPAVEFWQRAAALVLEAGDGEALAVLKDRVAALDPAAAEQMGSIETAAPPVEVPEISLELDAPAEDDDESSDGVSISGDEEDDEFAIVIDDETFEIETDSDEGESQSELQAANPEASATAVNPSSFEDDDSVEFDFDVDELTQLSTDSVAGSSTTTSAKIGEELEEAEFYLAQDMYDEAEEILSRVLELVPNHPSAMLRMGEIEAARGGHPNSGVEEATADETSVVAAEQTFDGSDSDVKADAGAETEAEIEIDVDVDIDDDDDDDDDDEIEVAVDENSDRELHVDVDVDASVPEEPAGEEPEQQSAAVEEDEGEVPDADSADEDSEASFDLREALADVLSDDEETPTDNASSSVLSTVEDGFGSIFSDFKKGVSATLEEGDFETRYDLGIAYREMGLYEDAIGEFRICLDSPTRRFDSLYLMGICARDLSRFADSVNHFEQALALPKIPSERLAGVYFDLALAHVGAGETDRACDCLRQTIEFDASFPGAAERLAELEAGAETSPQLAEPGEVFESFDDLFEAEDDEGGDDEIAEAIPAEAFESFDDVVAEAEALPDAEVVEAEPENAAVSDEAAPSDAETKSRKKSGRKKISFV
jgi:tetratricopeptide (TPR) repeat protein